MSKNSCRQLLIDGLRIMHMMTVCRVVLWLIEAYNVRLPCCVVIDTGSSLLYGWELHIWNNYTFSKWAFILLKKPIYSMTSVKETLCKLKYFRNTNEYFSDMLMFGNCSTLDTYCTYWKYIWLKQSCTHYSRGTTEYKRSCQLMSWLLLRPGHLHP